MKKRVANVTDALRREQTQTLTRMMRCSVGRTRGALEILSYHRGAARCRLRSAVVIGGSMRDARELEAAGLLRIHPDPRRGSWLLVFFTAAGLELASRLEACGG